MDDKFNQLVEYCVANDRVCPMPLQWLELSNMLPNKKRLADGGIDPPRPMILGAWHTPLLYKMVRLREHLNWAKEQGALEEVSKFIYELKETDWFHVHD